MSSESTTCPSCGTSMFTRNPGTLCPRCMLGACMGEPDDLPSDAPREEPGTVIGRYKLIEEIGEGGFGIVYLAEQTEPVKRMVALKVVKPGMDTREVVARFEAERQALALMDHPNIARVHDGGTSDRGRPYFVMELVKGVPLTTYCDKAQLNTRDRLDLFLDVLAAVQHAHLKGIIHRDLKPSNILVSPHDGKPVIKVIDFGIAKALSMELTSRTLFTGFGQMIGTPQYTSPEQAEMNALDVDTRSDIYSLGVVLYELLTGQTPLDARKLRESGYAEIQRLIREHEPPKPSTRIGTLGQSLPDIARHRGAEPLKLAKQLRGDLDWIVMKALEKDRKRRYETANGFAADLRRHLADEPVVACPPSGGYRLRKLLRRNRGIATGIGAVCLSALIGVGGIIWNWRAAEHARDKSERDSLTAIREWRRAEENAYVAHMLVAANQYKDRRLGGFRELLERHRPAPGKTDLRGWEWHYLNSLLNRELRTFGSGTSVLLSLAWHPGGKQVAAACKDGTLQLWNPATGGLIREWQAHEGPVHQVIWNPDGSLLCSAGQDGIVRLWKDHSTDPVLEYRAAAGPVRTVTWSPDGQRIASGGDDRTLRLWNSRDGTTDYESVLNGSVTALAFHPADPLIACATHGTATDNSLMLFSTAVGVLSPGFTCRLIDPISHLAWSPDGETVAASFLRGQGHVATLGRKDQKIAYHKHHSGTTTGIDWSRDGRTVASSCGDGTAQCWNLRENRCLFLLAGHRGPVNGLRWSPDGGILATFGSDGLIKLWKPAEENFPSVSREFRGWVTGIAWNSESTRVAVAAGTGESAVVIMDPATLKTVRTLPSPESFLWDVSWSPDGTRVAAIGHGTVHVWDSASGTKLGSLAIGWVGFSLCWSPDSKRLLVVRLPDWNVMNEQCSITVVDADGSRSESRFLVPGLHRACWTPDGTGIITCGAGGMVERWDWKQGIRKGVLYDAGTVLLDLKWSPDGRKLALSGQSGRLMIVNSSGGLIWDVVSQTSGIESLSWSPDNSRIASVASDGSLKIRSADSGEEVFQVQAHGAYGFSVAWSPDGRRIATGGYDRKLRVWDSAPEPRGSNPEGIFTGTKAQPANRFPDNKTDLR